jgi:hypothetical protein
MEHTVLLNNGQSVSLVVPLEERGVLPHQKQGLRRCWEWTSQVCSPRHRT